jgi:hypothetical protein
LVDLIFHPYPSKLLLLLPVHTGNPPSAVRQAEVILGRFLVPSNFRVVLAGDSVDGSVVAIRRALVELGVDVAVGVEAESGQRT